MYNTETKTMPKKTFTKLYPVKITLLILAFCLSFCTILSSCDGGSSQEYQKTYRDYVRDQIEYRIKGTLYSSGYTFQSFTSNISHYDTDTYEVHGKVTVRDKYGDIWTGNYDAMVDYDVNDDSYRVRSFNMGSIYKQR